MDMTIYAICVDEFDTFFFFPPRLFPTILFIRPFLFSFAVALLSSLLLLGLRGSLARICAVSSLFNLNTAVVRPLAHGHN